MRGRKARSIFTKRKSIATGSEAAILDRVLGVETEYGFRYSKAGRRDSQLLYRTIIESFARRAPLVASYRNPNRYFLANGGSVSWEPSLDDLLGFSGFVEISTPQCRSPRQLVTYLHAYDSMVDDTLREPVSGEDHRNDNLPVSALRNNGDAFGHNYGQQENYEVEIARGVWLFLWRLSLLVLLPLLIFHRILVQALLWFTLRRASQKLSDKNFDLLSSGQALDLSTYRSLQFAAKVLQACHAPIEWLFERQCKLLLLRQHKHALGCFLASRTILDGSGHVDRFGSFWISARAKQSTDYIGFSGDGVRRPMIDLSHCFRSLCLDDSKSFKALRRLFRKRQRIQICCGDTSTNDAVRWLQIGSTSLVLDLIESGAMDGCPHFSSYVRTLRMFARDNELEYQATDRKGKRYSAIELQWLFIKGVRQFLTTKKRVPPEAWEILNSWQMMVSRIESRNTKEQDYRWLLGRSDWLTKKTLLNRLPSQSNIAAKKKIDMRYHEIGRDGYANQIVQHQKITPLFDRQSLERAIRMPPSGTAATHRGYLIREFFDSHHTLEIDWDDVKVVDQTGV